MMPAVVRLLLVSLVLLGGWAAPPPLAEAANLDTTADRVFGQPDFSANAANYGGVTATHHIGTDSPAGAL